MSKQATPRCYRALRQIQVKISSKPSHVFCQIPGRTLHSLSLRRNPSHGSWLKQTDPYTVKKVSDFPVSSRDVTYQTLPPAIQESLVNDILARESLVSDIPARESMVSDIPARESLVNYIPARESLISDITAGDGKVVNLFYSV